MWTGNSNNDGGEKAQGLADGVQQNERTYITVLYGSKKHQNIKRPKVQSKMEERCANKDLEEFVPADDVQCKRDIFLCPRHNSTVKIVDRDIFGQYSMVEKC